VRLAGRRRWGDAGCMASGFGGQMFRAWLCVLLSGGSWVVGCGVLAADGFCFVPEELVLGILGMVTVTMAGNKRYED